MRRYLLILFPSHLINGGSWLLYTSLGYKIKTFTHPKERSYDHNVCKVLCLWLHEVRISSFDFSLMLKDFQVILCPFFMMMVRMNSSGHGSGSSSQLLLRQFPDGTWNNVEHLGQSNK